MALNAAACASAIVTALDIPAGTPTTNAVAAWTQIMTAVFSHVQANAEVIPGTTPGTGLTYLDGSSVQHNVTGKGTIA